MKRGFELLEYIPVSWTVLLRHSGSAPGPSLHGQRRTGECFYYVDHSALCTQGIILETEPVLLTTQGFGAAALVGRAKVGWGEKLLEPVSQGCQHGGDAAPPLELTLWTGFCWGALFQRVTGRPSASCSHVGHLLGFISRRFFQTACDVPELQDKFNVDEYSDLVTLTKPVIYISIGEIINTHTVSTSL